MLGPAAALFVLDERQDVGEWEGPAALATGQKVTALVSSLDLWSGRMVLWCTGAIRCIGGILNCTQVLRSASKFASGHRVERSAFGTFLGPKQQTLPNQD